MKLSDIIERVPDCLAAAWVDVRTGALADKRDLSRSSHVAFGLEAMASILCSPDRPERTVMLSRTHVFIANRCRDAARVLLVCCSRAANIGFAIAAVSQVVDEVAA